jgi:prolipoprotein diacylglyceryltransferase
MIFFVFIWIACVAIVILGTIFWVFMLVDVAKRKFKSENDKIAWILVVVLAHIIGAIIYYFVIKKSSNKISG